jgi:multiple sugar transport system ATP-binding protein
MGRAIVRDPKVFLFDEPLSNLDAKLRVQMRGEIKQLHQRLGTTTVYVTHDQIEAMTMADEMVVMKDGRIEQRGAPLALYDWPETIFVAGFIGSPSMNMLAGTIIARDAGYGVKLADGTVLPVDGSWDAHLGRRVVYGIRPEDIVLGGRDLAVSVDVIEPTGPETQVLGMVGGERVTILLKSRVGYQLGDVVHFAIDHNRAHVFDAESGRRLSAGQRSGTH